MFAEMDVAEDVNFDRTGEIEDAGDGSVDADDFFENDHKSACTYRFRIDFQIRIFRMFILVR